MTTTETVVKVDGLSKRYKKVQAVDNLSFEVPKGSVYGILGPNGSGKTTTLGILLGVIQANSGQYTWLGNQNGHEARQGIGSILETPNFYPYLSAVENLRIVASIKGCGTERIEEVLQTVNLWQRKKSAFKTYSLGMKQRLALAAALLSNPEVLVLDEPTNGLDPVGIAEVRELIKSIGKQGITVIIASHMLDEIEKVCTDVLVLQKGVKRFEGKVADVLTQGDKVSVAAEDMDALGAALEQIQGLSSIQKEPLRYSVQLSPELSANGLNKALAEKGIWVDYIQRHNQSLEQYFLQLTKSKDQ